MNTFISLVLIQNTVAEYEIFKKGDRYKAFLILNDACAHLPLELLFWKEGGQWKSSHLLGEHALYQFGYTIDNHILSSTIAEWKLVAA